MTLASAVPVIGAVAVVAGVMVAVRGGVAVAVCVPVSVAVAVTDSETPGILTAVTDLGALVLVLAAIIGTVTAEPTSSGKSKDLTIRRRVLNMDAFIALARSFLFPLVVHRD